VAVVELDLASQRGVGRYSIHIEPGVLAELGERVASLTAASRCALVMDAAVAEPYGRAATDALRRAGLDPVELVLPSGESTKNLAQVEALYHAFGAHRLERGSVVVALGGGVAGDTSGFAAASYLRGLPFVQCPTTLLSMVDSSVGGKVGVNLPEAKNLVGAFHQPLAVFADPETLRTLAPRELSAGLAECIKHGVLGDADLFEFTAKHMRAIRALEMPALVELVERNVQVKADVVRQDEREAGIRAHLNLGHTFGHAIEATSGYGQLLHGEAVGLGMLAAGDLAERLGLCGPEVRTRIAAALSAAGLPVQAELAPADALRDAMSRDKKVSGSRVRFVLPARIGQVVMRDEVPDRLIDLAWESIRSRGG